MLLTPEGRVRRIGFDVGGVIADASQRYTDPNRWPDGSDHLNTHITTGIVEAIGTLVGDYEPENAFVISKCRPGVDVRTRQIFRHINFYERTGISPDNVYFCQDREGKVPIADELELTDIVDDRLEIGGLLLRGAGVENFCLFRPSDEEVTRYTSAYGSLDYHTAYTSEEMVSYFQGLPVGPAPATM